jgi:hypothetical protein
VKPCDVGIDTHRLTGSQSVALMRQPAASRHFRMNSIRQGVPQSNFSRRKITLRYAASVEEALRMVLEL